MLPEKSKRTGGAVLPCPLPELLAESGIGRQLLELTVRRTEAVSLQFAVCFGHQVWVALLFPFAAP